MTSTILILHYYGSRRSSPFLCMYLWHMSRVVGYQSCCCLRSGHWISDAFVNPFVVLKWGLTEMLWDPISSTGHAHLLLCGMYGTSMNSRNENLFFKKLASKSAGENHIVLLNWVLQTLYHLPRNHKLIYLGDLERNGLCYFA